MMMVGKRIIFLIHNKSKKYLFIIPAVLLAVILACSAILANTLHNPLAGKYIIIDPGHGGIDSGTSDASGFAEKNINLEISLKLKEVLESKDAIVDMTRDRDIALDDRNNLSTSRHRRDLLARVEMFNSGKYDLFISIHVNRSSNPKAAGPITLYSTNLPSSALLASSIQEKLNSLMNETYNTKIDRSPVKADFFILKHSEYQEKLSKFICSGIAEYFRSLEEFNKNNLKDDAPNPAEPADEYIIPGELYDIQLVRN
jgi:N-acetylmuramoyl-L-alanine amidase